MGVRWAIISVGTGKSSRDTYVYRAHFNYYQPFDTAFGEPQGRHTLVEWERKGSPSCPLITDPASKTGRWTGNYEGKQL